MSDSDDFDSLLKQRFDREHQHVPADAFVEATLQRIRIERRRAVGIRTAVRAAALVAAVIASPWLITAATRLNSALESSLAWTAGLPGVWAMGALAAVALLIVRVRSR
jgi:hypothetical protein